ncbi:MAG: DUF1684 domain-containing protein [Myxococcales bacterium]|nr:DUF1684 domain-containing protein [Myxococcales bacterium]MCB9713567.1 DUF1684 domain-containing protein [Myxococcales bacterium]
MLRAGLSLMPWALVVAGCASPPVLPPGWTLKEAEAFQQEHEGSVSGPQGPLAAVASHYVEPGQVLELGVVDGQPSLSPPAGAPRVRLSVTDEGARCLEGCGPTEVALTEPRTIALGRLTLQTSPQSGTLRVLVLDPEAPGRQAFDGLRWFPADARFIVPARWEPDPELPSIELSTSRGLSKTFVRAGVLRAELLGQPIALAGYRSGAVEGGPLLVPLTDETTGTSTYPVGRYLEVALPAEGAPVLDLNRLTNPWCAYSEHFNCPVPPAENRLPVAVEAGEEIYDQH